MQSLPSLVFQRATSATGGRGTTTDVASVNIQSSVSVTQIYRDRIELVLGDINETGGNLCGSAREKAGADPVSAEQTRRGICGSVVHGSRGPKGSVRDSLRSSALSNDEVALALGRMIQNAAGYGAAEGGGGLQPEITQDSKR